MPDSGNLLVIESAGAFLAVAADERDGTTFFEKCGTVLDLPILDLQIFGDIFNVNCFHLICYQSCDNSFNSSLYAEKILDFETNPI